MTLICFVMHTFISFISCHLFTVHLFQDDQCGNRNIVCGSFAICAVIDTVTQQQGCICYDGFLPNTTAEEGCVGGYNASCHTYYIKTHFIPTYTCLISSDPCDGVTCGSNARCVVDPNKVIGHCECNSGFLPNNTAADGCFCRFKYLKNCFLSAISYHFYILKMMNVQTKPLLVG